MRSDETPRLSPISELVGNVRFDDPWRWLEGEGVETQAWEARRTAEAAAALSTFATDEALVRVIDGHLSHSRRACPRWSGSQWFRVDRCPEGHPSRLLRLSDWSADGTEVIEAGQLEREPASIDWWHPSPDGSLVALGVSSSGDEQCALHIVRVDDGEVLGPRLAHASGGGAVWSPDSGSLYCLLGTASDAQSMLKDLYRVEVDVAPRIVPMPQQYRRRRAGLQLSGSGRYLAVIEQPAAPRIACVCDLETGRWSGGPPIDEGVIWAGFFAGDEYYAVTTDRATRGRVVMSSMAGLGDPTSWTEVVGEGEEVLRAITRCGDELVLCYYSGGASALKLRALEGDAVLRDVPLPGRGLASTDGRSPEQYGVAPPVNADETGLCFAFAAHSRPPQLARYDKEREALHWAPAAGPQLDVSSSLEACESADGTTVGYELVECARAGAGPRATLLVVYGGWNAVSGAAGYPGELAAFIEAGGTLVYAHVRGDATFGADQWRAGRRRTKQRTIDDVLAVAEHLISRERTSPSLLGLWGASNGALVAGAAMTQRPDLFKVVVALVPLFDLGRLTTNRFGEHVAWEYGDPAIPEEARWLRAYSPYHNVRARARYPRTLIVAGENDLRTPRWHGRKMFAALQHSASVDRDAREGGDPDGGSGSPAVLFRVYGGRGHESTTDGASAEMVAERVGFVMSELGLYGPGVRPATQFAGDPIRGRGRGG